jgi:hypothetical protein
MNVNFLHLQPFHLKSGQFSEEFYYIWHLKSIGMKRKLFYATGLILIAFAFTSCEAIKNCKICQQNTYNATTGALLTEGSETEYCDASLLRIEATPDATALGVTSKWICR